MTVSRTLAAMALGLGVTLVAVPASAQVSNETKVSHDTTMQNGVATRTTKVEHVRKVKTRHPKKILGVKVGHKTRTTKTIQTRSVSSNGDHSSSTEIKH
ncbi:hypothetical protein [Novosphingobium terrae]|uniref:hypothetical protein n=1 Tax=Novosphingobium terrae TaxID=2726189 RepID=UPI00197DB4E0|nr:hypothetical protein [Novosphingobium terrae]